MTGIPEANDPKSLDHAEIERRQAREGLLDTREIINSIDTAIIAAMAERFGQLDKIVASKRVLNIAALQSDRYEEMMRARVALGEQLGVPPEITRAVFDLLHDYSVGYQQVMLGEVIAADVAPLQPPPTLPENT